ncbi:hypothetical protein BD410DRAFT_733689, partial [Rickenella mellea]
MFIKDILGVNSAHSGLWGDTKAYYGTVEQQGRLTLHLHLLLWIENALSPQQIRDRLLNGDSKFQTQIVSYLESLEQGSFLQGSIESVRDSVNSKSSLRSYQNPTETLPNPPPSGCGEEKCNKNCKNCAERKTWWEFFQSTVDDLLLKSNVHTCRRTSCLKNKYGTCKARFPRDVHEETTFDPETGSIELKHGEAQLNTFTSLLTYLIRCNSDVTSLLSGTAIKAVISYVTDYITKSPLKTHTIFDAVRSIFDK